jgi:hypothetical protein
MNTIPTIKFEGVPLPRPDLLLASAYDAMIASLP